MCTTKAEFFRIMEEMIVVSVKVKRKQIAPTPKAQISKEIAFKKGCGVLTADSGNTYVCMLDQPEMISYIGEYGGQFTATTQNQQHPYLQRQQQKQQGRRRILRRKGVGEGRERRKSVELEELGSRVVKKEEEEEEDQKKNDPLSVKFDGVIRC
ncbi:hypothetical protein CRG98_018089 [Punica granatum]|uniref:Uncharacterized protein n=1 Tax=Punica granatum TaxID=22663 RepID=A0A2I0JYW2_PUNGR|nr:hypothetical protein CRG98_018089 [Punica granatum]